MFEKIINTLFSQKHKLTERNFDYKIFKSDIYQNELQLKGFVHLKNVLDKSILQEYIYIYENAKHKFDCINKENNVINSIAYKDIELKKYISSSTINYLHKSFEDILNVENLKFPTGGTFCTLKPKHEITFKPHQDPAYVDETKTYSAVGWFPLTDVDENNGCLYVIPGTHIWNNFKRSISMDWAFEKYSNLLSKHMIPIPAEFGDLIMFDGSLIHASKKNLTDNTRLAVNVAIVNKNSKLQTYHPINHYFANKYEIDGNYFIEELLFNKPSDKFKKNGIELLNNKYTEMDVIKLLEGTNHYLEQFRKY